MWSIARDNGLTQSNFDFSSISRRLIRRPCDSKAGWPIQPDLCRTFTVG
jgi:hypothetical protein